MTVMVCVDDRGGMTFNGRRQSRDRVLRQDLLREAAGGQLWMTAASARQFKEDAAIHIAENFLDRAGEEDFCFAEKPPLKPWEEKIHRLVVYRWGTVYPADGYLDLEIQREWKLETREEFRGFSHGTITKEVYVPCSK